MIGPEKGKPYWNPYVAGAVLGLLVVTAFAAGKWFGASSAFVNLAKVLRGDVVSRNEWMGYEVAGLALGGFLGALAAGRFAFRFTRGSRVGGLGRTVAALVGGALVMIGSRFAAGCTSGLALTGGVRMSAGAYVFMGTMFLAGFLAAGAARRLWS